MADVSDQARTWWQTYTPEEGTIGHWQIGPSSLWITRYPQEWRIAHHQIKDASVRALNVTPEVDPSSIQPEALVSRFTFTKAPQRLTLSPLMADRPVVIKPQEPFYVQSNEEITFYVATSAWLEISVGEPGKKLMDVASFRPSDTWFGSSTIEGELCYASSTLGRLRLEDIPLAPHRVVTAVQLRNKAKDALYLERLKLPVQYLAVFESNHQLWTQTVSLTREQGGDLAELKIAKAPPNHLNAIKKLSNSREKAGQNLVVRAFSKLFS